MTIVIKKDVRIVANKLLKGLLYAVMTILITLAIDFISGGGLPVDMVAYGAIIMLILETVKKALEQYKPEFADKFEWFFTALLSSLKSKK